MVNNSRLKCELKKFHLSLVGIFRPFFMQKNKNIQHINEGRKSPAKQLSAGNNYSLTSCVGSNPRPKHASLSPPASFAALRAGYIYSGNKGVSLSYQMHKREDT